MLPLIRKFFFRVCGPALVCLAAAAQCTPAPIAPGQTLAGTLNSTCTSTRRPGSYAKLYTFSANVSAAITIAITSTAFDGFAYLIGPGGSVVASDDESGGNRNPLIRYTAAATGTYTAEVTSSGPGAGGFAIALTVIAAGAPVIAPNGVVNGASYLPGIAAGSWITIRGANLSATTRIWEQSDFKSDRLPLSLDGVSVKVNNKDAPVYFISPTQINALAPADPATGSVAVTVANSRGASAPVSANLQRVAPAWFAFSQQGGRYPAAVHADGTYLGPATLFGASATSIPAIPGETMLLFGTGFGPTALAADPLQVISGAIPLATPGDLAITVGGSPAQVAFAGLTGNGMYQFNVVVPALPDGEHNLIASIGGLQTQTLRLAVRTPPLPPVITTVSPKDFVWGQSSQMTLTGTGMSGADKVEFSDPSHLRIVTSVSAFSTGVSFRLSVDGEAAPGERTVTVVSPNGRSNAIPFTVRRGNPRLTSMRPTVVYPDRIYAPSNFLYTSSLGLFSITGSDLAGVDQIEFSPSTGLATAWTPAPSSISGVLFVGADTPLGVHQMTASSPGGTSNSLAFDVRLPPSTAPVISDVTLRAPTLSGNRINYRGTITFTDSNADIRSGCTSIGIFTSNCAFIRMAPVSNAATFDVTGSFVDLPGQTGGTIDFNYTTLGLFLMLRSTTTVKVAVTLFDAAGQPSNSIVVDVPSWIAPLL